MYLDWNNQLSLIEKWILFSVGILFIVLPLIGNLVQLHNEIQMWVSDVYSKHTVQAWIRSYLRFLYMITIICGSAFAAVDICNSNIFHLPMFNMGLNKRQLAIFKNQRILSTVLLENIPQLALQIIYLVLTAELETNVSPITIIAMIFSSISIISSVFDYKSSSLFIKCETITLVEMDIESRDLAATKSKKFQQIIVHHRIPICHELSKIIFIDSRLIEILMPVQTKTGAKLIFHIRNNSNDKNIVSDSVKIITKEINSGQLAKVFFNVWKRGGLKRTPKIKLIETKQIRPDKNLFGQSNPFNVVIQLTRVRNGDNSYRHDQSHLMDVQQQMQSRSGSQLQFDGVHAINSASITPRQAVVSADVPAVSPGAESYVEVKEVQVTGGEYGENGETGDENENTMISNEQDSYETKNIPNTAGDLPDDMMESEKACQKETKIVSQGENDK